MNLEHPVLRKSIETFITKTRTQKNYPPRSQLNFWWNKARKHFDKLVVAKLTDPYTGEDILCKDLYGEVIHTLPDRNNHAIDHMLSSVFTDVFEPTKAQEEGYVYIDKIEDFADLLMYCQDTIFEIYSDDSLDIPYGFGDAITLKTRTLRDSVYSEAIVRFNTTILGREYEDDTVDAFRELFTDLLMKVCNFRILTLKEAFPELDIERHLSGFIEKDFGLNQYVQAKDLIQKFITDPDDVYDVVNDVISYFKNTTSLKYVKEKEQVCRDLDHWAGTTFFTDPLPKTMEEFSKRCGQVTNNVLILMKDAIYRLWID